MGGLSFALGIPRYICWRLHVRAVQLLVFSLLTRPTGCPILAAFSVF